MIAKQQTLSEEEIGAGCSLPVQSPVTTGDAPLGAPRRRQGSAAQRQVQADARASLQWLGGSSANSTDSAAGCATFRGALPDAAPQCDSLNEQLVSSHREGVPNPNTGEWPPSRGGDESSRGSSRGSPASRLASCQTMMGARPPISSLPPEESRHSTPCTWAGTTTPYACSPRTRIDVSDVSDALKEHCTSALSSTLRGVTSLNEQHKTQIMDSYCHEVCVVLQDFEGLQRENIFVCHRQESDALRSALRLEYDRQQQILHEKLAARHHARELAAKAANEVQETVKSVLALDATETFVKNKHACACTGTRDESGACRDCWALRFQVKSRNIAAVLNAASTLLVRQAEVLPGLRDRLGPEPLVTMNKAQDPAEAGASVAAEASGRGSEEQRAERCVTRPVTAAGGRGLGATLPEGWVVRTSRSTGKDFYYHSASKKTQWLRPD